MLQQTQVVRVVPKYGEFLGRFPTLESVAAASPMQVRDAWSGLGYYARARNLHRLARTVAAAAVRADPLSGAPSEPATLPSDPVALRALPGVGAYTAGAVASFAYHHAAALVDTNVARVLTRVFTRQVDPRTPAGRRIAWAIAAATLPRAGTVAYTHNQALMELGALICTARAPRCAACPVRTMCATRGEMVVGRSMRRVAAAPARPRPDASARRRSGRP
jgi:A/G-specific adenine glycosylase